MNEVFLILIFLIVVTIAIINFLAFRNFGKKGETNLDNTLLEAKLDSQKLYFSQLIQENSSKNQTTLEVLQARSESAFKLYNESQKTEFESLKLQNSEKLNQIQQILESKLNQSIENLIKLNRESFELLSKSNQKQLDEINLGVQKRLDENFARSLESFEKVNNNLGMMEQKAKLMIDSTKSIEKLNTIFARTSSKAFGGFAENYLEKLISEHLASGTYASQVKVPNSSEIIDFVLYVGGKKIGIDCKFPLTKYQDFLDADTSEKPLKLKELTTTVLEMAKSINQKYYRGNFVDILLLYLPSESLYLEILNSPNASQIFDKLAGLKLSLISPNTFLPQLLLIQSYQVKQSINQNAEIIFEGLKNVKKNILSFRDEYRKLGDKLRQAQQNYEQADKNLLGVETNILTLESRRGEENVSTEIETEIETQMVFFEDTQSLEKVPDLSTTS